MIFDLCLQLALIDDETDQVTFRDVCNRYKATMLNIAMGLTKDYYDAQEAISISLFAIARNIKRIDSSDEERTKRYVCKIVKNAAFDILRKRQRTDKVYSLDDFEDMEYTENISDTIEGNEQYKAIVLLIQSMPEPYRDVVSLRFLNGLRVASIARSLGKPASTVRKRLIKGTEMLKEILRENNFYE